MYIDIDQFVGKDIWVYAELSEYEDEAYIRIVRFYEDTGDIVFNGWLSEDGNNDVDEVLYGELTTNIDDIVLYPTDTVSTDRLIDMIKGS